MNLKNILTEDLEKELLKRKNLLEEQNKIVPLKNPNFSEVIFIAVGCIEDEIKGNEHNYSDNIHYLYVEILKAIYGKDIFDRLRKIRK